METSQPPDVPAESRDRIGKEFHVLRKINPRQRLRWRFVSKEIMQAQITMITGRTRVGKSTRRQEAVVQARPVGDPASAFVVIHPSLLGVARQRWPDINIIHLSDRSA